MRVYKREKLTAVPIDLTPLVLSEESFLCDVIRELPSPGNYGNAVKFKAVLPALAANSAAAAVLRMRTSALRHADLNLLYEAIEDAVDQMPIGRKHSSSAQARAIFNRTSVTLAGGTLLSDVGFHSRFPSDARRTSPHPNPLLKPNPISTKAPLKFNSFEERNSAFLEQAKGTKAYILSLCEKTFENHATALAMLGTAQNQQIDEGIKDTGSHFWKRKLLELPEDVQLALIIRKLEKGIAPSGISFKGLKTFASFQGRPTARYIYEITQSNLILPQIVLVACLVALIVETAWNLETCLDLTPNNIKSDGKKFNLIGVKGRSNKVQDGEVPIIDGKMLDQVTIADAVPAKAIELLLWHARALEGFLKVKSPALFISFVRKDAGKWEFFRFKPDLVLAEFCALHRVEQISFRQLRQLAGQLDYLSPGGNIYSTQLLLQHATVGITQAYLHTALFIRLFEENSRRFMHQMAATAFFVTGRKNELKARGLDDSDINLALFPAAPSSNEPSISEEWFKRDDLKFPVGMEELRYCAIQYSYYRSSHEDLIAENPTRFVKVHLPRLVFCVSLREVILNSIHAGLYRKFEREWL